MAERVSPAFAAVADACRWPRPDAPPAFAGAALDWTEVERIARNHRVTGFVADAVARTRGSIPSDTAAHFADIARANAASGLRGAAEEITVDRALRAAGLRPLFVKGATLARLAYDSFALKSSMDVDVLVAPENLATAGRALAALGYQRVGVAAHEEKWHHAGRGSLVELHHALVDHPQLLAGVGVDSPRQSVELMSGARVETLATAPLFAYLCVHGAMHGWERLKWLADVAALIRTDIGRAEDLLDAAEALGGGAAPGAALLLAHRLLALPLPPHLLARLERKRHVGRAADFSTRRMAAVSASGDGYATGVRHEAGLLVHHLRLRRDLPGAAAVLWSTLAIPRWPFQQGQPPWRRVVFAAGALPVMLARRWLKLRRSG